MTFYPKSAYGTVNVNAGYPANGNWSAWGGWAWPKCPPASLTGLTSYRSAASGQTLTVSVRKELVPLWDRAFAIADRIHHYPIYATGPGGVNWGPWGGSCRAIAGTTRASGHSAWLAVDVNAPNNPYSYTFQCDIPPGLVTDWESLGLFWGGRYVGQKFDPMHWGYCRAPADVATFVARADTILGTAPTPPPEDDMPLNDADKKFITDTVANLLNKFFNQDKSVNTLDSAATPNHQDYTVTGALERLIRIETLDATGQVVKFHPS